MLLLCVYVGKYTVGCMYLAKINNNIKKDVKVQRRRDELELQFCWREMLKTVMETVCNRGSLPKLSISFTRSIVFNATHFMLCYCEAAC